jgi:hypothetical protein
MTEKLSSSGVADEELSQSEAGDILCLNNFDATCSPECPNNTILTSPTFAFDDLESIDWQPCLLTKTRPRVNESMEDIIARDSIRCLADPHQLCSATCSNASLLLASLEEFGNEIIDEDLVEICPRTQKIPPSLLDS